MAPHRVIEWLRRELGGRKRWTLFAEALGKGDFEALSYMIRMWCARNLGFSGSKDALPPPAPRLQPKSIAPNPLEALQDCGPPMRDTADLPSEDVLVELLLSRISPLSPRVSIVIPCYNYGKYVAEAVESCLRQSYTNVDVIVVDDGSTEPGTQDVLRTLARENVVVLHQENMGLSRARNNGAARATGEFLVFLDADDSLDINAIALMLNEFVTNPSLDIVYPYQRFFGDEDMVWVCQEFNAYDLLWSNHPSVCLMIKREAFEGSKKYQPSMKYGYEDWEFALGCSGQNRRFGMLPVPVFNHRRHVRSMTAEAQERKHFLFNQLRLLNCGLYTPERVTQLKRETRPLISIIIPFYNGHAYIEQTLESIGKQTTDDYEVILVNDGSDDPAALLKLDEIQSRGSIRIVHQENKGLSGARNRGALEARGDFLLYLDSDDILEPGFCEKLALKLLLSPELAFGYSGVIHFGDVNGTVITEFDIEHLKRENYIAFTTLIRRYVYLRLGGMDESMHDNFEDYDFWLRLVEQGYLGGLVPEPLFRYRRHGAGKMARIIKHRPGEDRQHELQKRHPFLYGASRSKPRPTALEGQGSRRERDTFLSDVQAFHRQSRFGKEVPYRGYRRQNTPNLFGTTYYGGVSGEDGRINLLYLIPYMVIGGAERIDLDILHGLDKAKFRVILVVELQANHQWYDLFAACVDEMFLCANFLSSSNQIDRFLDYLIVAKNIDIVLNRNTNCGYRAFQRWFDRTKNIRFVDLNHLHNFGEDWLAQASSYHALMHRRYLTNHDLLRYVSTRYGVGKESFRVVHCGVDAAVWDPQKIQPGLLKAEMKFRAEEKLLGFVGRFDQQKDPLRWLRVASEIRRRDHGYRFVMVGGGPLLDGAMVFAKSIGLGDAVHFTGNQTGVSKLVRDFDCLLLVSKYEGLPQVVIEALSLGVPVVSTDAGGTRECVTPEVGTILPLAASDGG